MIFKVTALKVRGWNCLLFKKTKEMIPCDLPDGVQLTKQNHIKDDRNEPNFPFYLTTAIGNRKDTQ